MYLPLHYHIFFLISGQIRSHHGRQLETGEGLPQSDEKALKGAGDVEEEAAEREGHGPEEPGQSI